MKASSVFKRPDWMRPFIQEPVDSSSPDSKTASVSTILLCVVVILGLGLQTVSAVLTSFFIPSAVLWGLSLVFLVVYRPRTVSWFHLVLSVTLSILNGVWLLTLSNGQHHRIIIGIVSGCLICSILDVILFVRLPFRDIALSSSGISKPFTTPSNALRSPEDNITLWQWMSVSWLSPLIKIGSNRQLNPDDVWLLPYEFQHQHLHDAFRSLKGGVVRRLIRANWIDLVIISFLAVIELTGTYASPLILQKLLRAMDIIYTDKQPAIFWTTITLAVRFVVTQSSVFSLWYARRGYERSRGEMITMIYEKTLHRKIQGGLPEEKVETPIQPDERVIPDGDLVTTETEELDVEPTEHDGLLKSNHQEPLNGTEGIWSRFKKLFESQKASDSDPGPSQPASLGKILNLMRNDVYEVAQRFWEFSALLNQPIGCILSFVLLWRLLGWPCLAGVAVVVIVQIFNTLLAKVLMTRETRRRKATDVKLQQITQYIEAIRHLRYYAWQDIWLDKIMTARQKELNLKVITNLWKAATYTVNAIGGELLPFVAFWAYTSLAGQRLTVDITFPALQLFRSLQNNLDALPQLIIVLLNASVAVQRIEDFLAEPDKDEEEKEGLKYGEHLITKHATFAWPKTRDPVLKDVSLTFPRGLTVVYGLVAAGKSALLQALLGELDLRAGELVRPSRAVAYCAQTPWLQSMSIRDNILFNGIYEEKRYKAILYACALVPDLATFEHGDLSPIGENGIGLSGGQKMRVALARAVYSRAETLLLDDPLSALDQQTAEHIVQHCLQGELLQDRTIILVTHRIDLCAGIAHQLVEMNNGRAHPHDPSDDHRVTIKADLKQQSDQNGDAGDIKIKQQDEAAAIPDKFEEEEHRAHGGVQAGIYWQYVKAGRLHWWLGVVVTSAVCRVVIVAQNWYLKEWSEAYRDVVSNFFATFQSAVVGTQTSPLSRFFDQFPDPAEDPNPWLIGLLVMIIAQIVLYLAAMAFAIVITYVAGTRLFRRIMLKVSSTTFRYYDITPVGRLMNRLTSDMGTVDGDISDILLASVWQAIIWLGAVLSIAFVTPPFLIAIMVLTILFVLIFLRFIPTSQSLRRLEMVSLTPLMSNFGALLDGLMTVRAFCAQEQFQKRIINTTDAFQQMDHFYWSLQAWLMYRFNLLSAFSTSMLTLLAIYSGLSPGLTAFVLVAAARFVDSTHELCKSYGKLQLDFVAVERVIELLHLDQEPSGELAPPASWPSTKDDIVFEDVTVSYAPHLDPALRDVSLTIPGGSSTAVVGRTGSGKSTLALSLLGTTPASSGRTLIGGIDIAKVDKHALRSRVTFLAQDPMLFAGTLRHNLDPTEEHTDAECESVLDRVCGTYGFTLTTEIDTGGKNLSQGQRQLVGLARAILRRSTIVIMDEATASIDRETAWEIQRVLKDELAGSTVITIAHRPSAVRGANMCIKLAGGRLEAVGSPDEVVPGDDWQQTSSAGAPEI